MTSQDTWGQLLKKQSSEEEPKIYESQANNSISLDKSLIIADYYS